MNIYTKTSAELHSGEVDHAVVHDLPELAASFASKIPADSNITPAECQAWLLTNRVDPLAAVNGAAAWAAQILENKSRGANVTKFSNEIDRPSKVVSAETSASGAAPTPSSPHALFPPCNSHHHSSRYATSHPSLFRTFLQQCWCHLIRCQRR